MAVKSGIRARRSFLKALAAVCAAAFGRATAAPGTADPSRIALVIGNNAYKQAPLANAANDARAMAEVLAEAGFQVSTDLDAPAESMTRSVREFGKVAERPEVKLAILYYAGHGVQVDWRNFLLPTDAKVASASDLRAQAMDLSTILAALPKSRDKVFVVILDACRDNPFGDAYRPERDGLSQFDAPLGTLIAFSTSPGSVASDGNTGHGLYTENLVRELAVRGLRIEDVFKRVRATVSLASKGLQIPWESTSLVSDVFVFPPQGPLSEEDLERQFEAEVEHWNRVKGSKNPADWSGLLRAFPNGKLCEIAQARLNLLLAQSATGGAARRLVVKRPRIELGPGMPVPDFLGRSPNPFSAGSYPIDRHFAVGDKATYIQIDPPHGGRSGKGQRRGTAADEEGHQVELRVTAVDREGDRVEFNRGRFVTDLLGNPLRNPNVEFDIPFQNSPAELQVGKRWSARQRAVRRGTREEDVDMSFEIVRRERVRVPAGEFDAFRLEGRSEARLVSGAQGRGRIQPARMEMVIWEVPGLNFPVKSDKIVYPHKGAMWRERRELETLRQGATG